MKPGWGRREDLKILKQRTPIPFFYGGRNRISEFKRLPASEAKMENANPGLLILSFLSFSAQEVDKGKAGFEDEKEGKLAEGLLATGLAQQALG